MTNLINADALLAQMEKYHEKRAEEANMTGDRAACVTWDDAVILIKSVPPVDAVPVRHGKWRKYYTEPPFFLRCSECGHPARIASNYCPDCGAKMDKE